jgi:hypothetical protein
MVEDQEHEPPTVAGLVEQVERCGADLVRLMKSGLVRKSYPLRTLVYRLEQARTMGRELTTHKNEIWRAADQAKENQG